jgi:hypothetical protein
MASVTILSDNGATSGSAGLKTSGGNDGVLLLQTTTSGGTPTTAITIDNTQTVTFTNQPTYTGGTANGVAYLNGSKVLTTGSALQFDGTNMGLGVTPSAWTGSFKAIQLPDSGVFGTQNQNLNVLANATFNSGWKYIASAYATLYSQSSGQHQWYNAPSGTAGNAITFTQAMTLDASGNLGVGTTSPTAPLDVSRDIETLAQIKRTTTTTGAAFLRFNNGGGNYYIGPDNSTGTRGFATGGAAYGLVISVESSYPLCFGTANTERARIDSSGNLLVGATSLISNEKLSVQTSVGTSFSNMYLYSSNASYSGSFAAFKINSATSGVYEFLRMFTSTQEVLRISGNGNIGNLNNSYGAISDIKLKENIVDTTPKLFDLMQVRVVNYNLKENPEQKQIGVIAQELEQVFPGMVDELRDTDADGNKLDTTTKSVKYSVFVPMLIKAIQEQQAIIQQLQADVAALKGQA